MQIKARIVFGHTGRQMNRMARSVTGMIRESQLKNRKMKNRKIARHRATFGCDKLCAAISKHQVLALDTGAQKRHPAPEQKIFLQLAKRILHFLTGDMAYGFQTRPGTGIERIDQ
jgi:hypothetical protein